MFGQFQFYGHCPIDECLYFSKKCKHNCIALGTAVPDNSTYSVNTKQMSIPEILFYKGELIPKATTRNLNTLKKEGIFRIKNIVVLYYYVDWLNHGYTNELHMLNQLFESEFKSKYVDDISAQYPFNVKQLNISPALMYFLTLSKLFKSYKKSSKIPVESNLTDLLEVSVSTLNRIRSAFKAFLKTKDIQIFNKPQQRTKRRLQDE